MKIEIPAFEPMLKANEHLRHGPISIDLGDDVVKVVRCKNCKRRDTVYCAMDIDILDVADDMFCSFGEPKEADHAND